MPRRASPFGPLSPGITGALLAAAAVGLGSPAQAECITQLNQQAPEGAHWSLHSDPVKNRRCWVLVDSSGRELSPPESDTGSSTVSTIQKFFSNLTGSADSPTPHRSPTHHVVDANRPPAGDHQMTQAERDALFEEFLRWHETQQGTGAPKQPPR